MNIEDIKVKYQADAVKSAKNSGTKKGDAFSELFKQRRMDLWQMAHC